MATEPLSHTQLIFPTASKGISSTLTNLKRRNLSISNRLHSIKQDAAFVQTVSEAYKLPLIANERCGSWYVPLDSKAGSAYFKSTDGHHGQWGFNLRRLNLQVLDIVGRDGGCIIVDSTRRGKSMPDALSKTVPIWISVLNRALFPHSDPRYHALSTPKDVVSRSEHAQIEALLPAFVQDFLSLGLDLQSLRVKLRHKPLRAAWVTPSSDVQSTEMNATQSDCHRIVLCTASGRATARDRVSSEYVQGAADDSESWAHGLSAEDFWTHQERLLSASEDELPNLIRSLASLEPCATILPAALPIHVMATPVFIACNAVIRENVSLDFDVVLSCSEVADQVLADKLKARYTHLRCASGKVGSRQLRAQLRKLDSLRNIIRPTSRTLVTCPTGKDLSVGVALAVICLLCNDDGKIAATPPPRERSKLLVKQRLSWIMSSMPAAAPSRATLQSVNAYLLGEGPDQRPP